MRLCRRLDSRHSVYVTPTFPRRFGNGGGYRHRALIGVGGNIGDTLRRIERLRVALGRSPQVRVTRTGAILRNPPFGYAQQRDFDNTVIEIATSLQPRALLQLVWRFEKRFGRTRSFPNAPRTLDLDILFFEDRVVQYKELIIPHPHWSERLSVLIPLRSLPSPGKTLRRRYENLDI
ncbi:MAG: 2-amino-4-hydroxy-6-hydroxymethyldihydropteridine diphosphokinase [Campylobacterota bacterium]